MTRLLPHAHAARPKLLLGAMVASALAACSGGSSSGADVPPQTGAAVTSVVQDRTFDPTGATLVLTFDEDVLQADAETTSFYDAGLLNVLGAAQLTPTTVRVTLDGPAVPGDVTLGVLAGIRNLDGESSSASSGLSITSTDTSPPAALELSAAAVVGTNNDQVALTFDDDMVESDVVDVSRWSIESPLGSGVDLTGAAVGYSPQTRVATLTLGGGQNLETASDVAVVLGAMRDIGGNTIEATSFGVDAISGTVSGDTTPPTLLAVYPGAAANTLRYVFDEPVKFVDTADLISQTPISGTRFTFAEASAPGVDIAAGSSEAFLDGLGAEVTFSVQPEAGDTASIFGVADLAGNAMQPVSAATVVARNAATPEVQPAGVTITAVEGERNDLLEVIFDTAVHPYGLDDTERYGLLFGFFENLSGASATWNGSDRITFVLEGEEDHDVQTGGSYSIAVVRFASIQGVQVDEISSDGPFVGVGDSVAPSLLSARVHPAASSDLIVEFSEAIRSDIASAAASFEITGSAATSATLLAPRVVRLVFAQDPTLGANLEVSSSALTDLAGNEAASSASIAVQASDSTAPSILSLTAIAADGGESDQVTAHLTESVNLSTVLDLQNVALTQDAAPVDLTGASIRYSSVDRSIQIQLAPSVPLRTGASVNLTFASLVDHAGLETQSASSTSTVSGDAAAPTTIEAFVNHRASVAGTLIDVQANEALGAAAESTASWSVTGGAAVVGVTRLALDRFRIEVSTAIGSAETLILTGATDLAGNTAGGPLVVDPLE